MLRTVMAGVIGLALIPAAHAAVDCTATSIKPVTLPETVVAPVASELHTRPAQLGAPAGVLSSTDSQEQSVDQVLMRAQVEDCRTLAAATPAQPTISANEPAAYKPQTEFDNTPWRFDMSQNGKRMTAEEFDAWMKSRGVRVVKARPAAPVAEAPAETPVETK